MFVGLKVYKYGGLSWITQASDNKAKKPPLRAFRCTFMGLKVYKYGVVTLKR